MIVGTQRNSWQTVSDADGSCNWDRKWVAVHAQTSSSLSLTSKWKSFVCINKRFVGRLESAFRNTETIHVNNRHLIYYVTNTQWWTIAESTAYDWLHAEAATIKIFVCKQKSNGGRRSFACSGVQTIFSMSHFSILSTYNEANIWSLDRHKISRDMSHMENWQKMYSEIAMRQILMRRKIFRSFHQMGPNALTIHYHFRHHIVNCIFIVAARCLALKRMTSRPTSAYQI